MPKQRIQFWLGNFSSKELFDKFFEETYSSEDNDGFISQFAKSQNEDWIDHDFLEIGFENEENSIKEKFANYSYAEFWIKELSNRATKIKLDKINSIVMLSYDGKIIAVKFPKSFHSENIKLEYLDEIDFEY